MLSMRRSLACCTRDREISIDFDEEERITTYNGLEGCIQNNQAYENESRTTRGEGCISDSLEDDDLSCSSSKDAFGSFSSKWLASKRDEQSLNYWELTESPQHFYVKEKPAYALQRSDAEAMKQKFSRLLLGEDITGGRSGVNSALAISNAITQLSVSVFGELWKLEPLPEEKKQKWQREMDWLLSPANYMVELVPAKQSGANGQTMEIMTPKARADIHMNLPALQKLDSMLIEILDSMVETEFWYTEVGSRAEGRTKSGKQSKRWWLPLPQVPTTGLTDSGRKKLLHQSKMVYQVFKAAKSINEQILLEVPVPTIIRDALPKSERAHLGDELYRILTAGSSSTEEILNSLMLKSENNVIDAINKLETAILSWKEKITDKTAVLSWKEKITDKGSSKSPIRTSWSFSKNPCTDQLELLLDTAEALVHLLKTRYHNLPLSFLDAMKVQYGKDVGHSILEAYSRVIRNLASRILSRMADILHEDALTNPGSPDKTFFSPEVFPAGNIQTKVHNPHVEHLGMACNTDSSSNSEVGFSPSEARGSSVSTTPSRSLVWCIVREACAGVSPRNSP